MRSVIDQTMGMQVIGASHISFPVSDLAEHPDRQSITHSGAIEVPPGAILNFRDPDDIALALFWRRP